MVTAAIVQPNYIPWKGYFDLAASVDIFVILDDVQYTRRDWRNRNRIKTPSGPAWLTIPVNVKGHFDQPINLVTVADKTWAENHWNTIKHTYAHAKYFSTLAPEVRDWYREAAEHEHLVDINDLFFRLILNKLNISTSIEHSSKLSVEGKKNERLISICKQIGATRYISGPSAQNYLDEAAFHQHGIDVTWMTYEPYPVYPQLFGDFVHEVSILDLLFNVGPESRHFYRKATHV